MKLRTGGVTWREIDGEMVVLDQSASRYLTTNRAGAVLMRELTEDRSLDELAGTLVKEFEISHDQAMEDVEEFVRTLRDKGLLVVD